MEIEEIGIVITKTGRPAAWEFGGGHKNSGNAQIIADSLGKPKQAIYERRRGSLALGEHALFPLCKGDYLVRATRGWRDEIIVLRVESIDLARGVASVARVATWEDGEWDAPPPEFLTAAIQAAVEKTRCYHCRAAHYIQR